MVNVQWHPRDFGTLLETEEQWPARAVKYQNTSESLPGSPCFCSTFLYPRARLVLFKRFFLIL